MVSILTLSGVFLTAAPLTAEDEQDTISVSIVPPGATSPDEPLADETVVPVPPDTVAAGATEAPGAMGSTGQPLTRQMQHSGVVTAVVRERTVLTAPIDQTGLMLSLWDDRGTAAGWSVSLATAPSDVLVLLSARDDTIARVLPQSTMWRAGNDVVTGRYLGLIAASFVPLLQAPFGSGDGVWTQPLDIGGTVPFATLPHEPVVLVLNLAFAP